LKGKANIGRLVGCKELIALDEVAGASYEEYESVDIVTLVMEVTSAKGCKAVIDGIGKSTMDNSINSGIFISFGNTSGTLHAFPVLRLIGKPATSHVLNC
jgi:NADPH2:quinone reductase